MCLYEFYDTAVVHLYLEEIMDLDDIRNATPVVNWDSLRTNLRTRSEFNGLIHAWYLPIEKTAGRLMERLGHRWFEILEMPEPIISRWPFRDELQLIPGSREIRPGGSYGLNVTKYYCRIFDSKFLSDGGLAKFECELRSSWDTYRLNNPMYQPPQTVSGIPFDHLPANEQDRVYPEFSRTFRQQWLLDYVWPWMETWADATLRNMSPFLALVGHDLYESAGEVRWWSDDVVYLPPWGPWVINNHRIRPFCGPAEVTAILTARMPKFRTNIPRIPGSEVRN